MELGGKSSLKKGLPESRYCVKVCFILGINEAVALTSSYCLPHFDTGTRFEPTASDIGKGSVCHSTDKHPALIK